MERTGALLRAWLEYEKARGLSPSTLEGWDHMLRAILHRLETLGVKDLTEITLDALERYFYKESMRPALTRDHKPLSRATLLSERLALSTFLCFLVKRGVLLRNEAERLNLGKLHYTFKAAPSRKAVALLLAAPAGDLYGLRDKAIIETFYSTGIRSGELCALDLSDCDRAAGILCVRKGKGGKGRIVPIGEKALKAVGRYLVQSRPKLMPSSPALFVGQWGQRLTNGMVGVVLRRWCQRAEIEPRITPHLLRHACATHLLENGAGIRHVQALLGHAKASTTAIYTRVSLKSLKEDLARRDIRARLERGPGEEPEPIPSRFSF